MKKILLSLAVIATIGANAQTHSDLSGNSTDSINGGYMYNFNGTAANNCTGNFDYFGNSDYNWGVDSGSGEATLSYVGKDAATFWSPWSNTKMTNGDCGYDGTDNVYADLDLSGGFDVKIRAKASDVGGALAFTVNSTIANMVLAAEKSHIFSNADSYEDIIFTFSAEDNGDVDFLVVEGLSFAVISNSDSTTAPATVITFDWIEVGGAIHDVSSNEVAVEGLNVFPNPANDVLNINFEANLVSSVQLTDLTGKVVDVQTAKVGVNTISFEVANVNAGVYFVNINNAAGNTAQKVIIK